MRADNTADGRPSASRDTVACELAWGYLLSFQNEGVTKGLLLSYLKPMEGQLRPDTIAEIYQRLLQSAQNAAMRAGVVGGSIGGISRLGSILCNFEPKQVLQRFMGGSDELLDTIERQVKPRGKIRRSPRSIWPLFSRTVITGAAFLGQFRDAEDFRSWVDVFDRDDRTRAALPMLLSYEIDGIGFPLACDFLKEMGYLNFGKPDVHVKAIFVGLGLARPRATDYQVFKAIVRVARSIGETPYYVDKLFWLVGSGNFYNHEQLGRGGRIRTDRGAFIRDAQEKLGTMRTC